MKYLLDTNVLSDFARGHAAVSGRLRREKPRDVAISVVTEFEVEYGLARKSSMSSAMRQAMADLVAAVEILPFEREDARVAGRLRAALAEAGQPIGPYDLLLAATALRRGLGIVTHNAREFARVGGLVIEDWRAA